MTNKVEGTLNGSRDARWKDMYACASPYIIDIDDKPVEFIKLGIYVWYEGMYFWSEQNLARDDVIDMVDVEIFSYLMNEMVAMVDGYMEERGK